MFQALEQIKKRFFDKNKRKGDCKKARRAAKGRVVVDRICVIGSKINGKMHGFKRNMQRLKDAVKPLEESVFGLACK